jgi:predicted ArsR family transcriptional regulator
MNACYRENAMKRNDFVKKCAAGVCGCGVLGFLAPLSSWAGNGEVQTVTAQADNSQLKQELDGSRERFAKLVSIMGEDLGAVTRDKVLARLGRECAQDYSSLFQKYSGDLPGFLAKIQTAWVEKAEYDEKTGILRIIGKPSPCVCPLVKMGRTPADFCNCTLGWQQEAFSTVIGKPVTAEIEETVLSGGKRCSFRITVKA